MRLLWVWLCALPLAAADVAVAPQSLSFFYQFNTGILPPQSVAITTPQVLPFTASRPAGQSWIQLSSNSNTATYSATTPAILTVGIDPGKLTFGTYTSAVTLQFADGAISVPVTLVVTGAPVLAASPAVVLFDPSAPFQNIDVTLSNNERFLTTVTTTTPWLKVTGLSTPLLATASAGPAGPGLSAGSIHVLSSSVLQVANNPLSVPALFLGSGLSSRGPLTLNPAALTFAGAAAPQQVTVTGGGFTATTDAKWLSAAAGQSLTVSVNPAGMNAGTYQGTVTLASSGVLQMLPVTLTVGSASLAKIVNAASYAEGGISPGEVVTLGGANLGPANLAGLTLDATGAVSTTLAGVQALFNGVAAPLIYASATQVAAVAPYDLDGKANATVQVTVNGQASNSLTVPVAPAAPGVFTANASGSGGGAILNSDNSLNGPKNPATKSETVAIYMTGEGQTTPPGVNGKVTTTPPFPRLPVTATIDGQDAAVTFAGEAPGIVSGVMQVNVQVPATARSGDLPLVVRVGGVASQSGVTVSVR